jgi:4-azaleucine resistance transporter AzlC
MRSLPRTDPIVRSVLAVAAAVFVVGASFGAIAATAHLGLLKTVAMSAFVFAGGAQFLALGVVSAGGSALAAVLAGLLLNARHLPFGLALADVIGRRARSRLVGSHLMVDESVAFALGQEGIARQRRAYWLTGTALFVAWNIGTAVGYLAGSSVGDPTAFGIDAAFPAGLLALVWPTLREEPALRVALVGAVLALATTPFLAPGLPVLVALLALVTVTRPATDGLRGRA